MRRVVITGIGAVTPFGVGVETLEAGLKLGRCGLSVAQYVAVDGLRATIVAEFPNNVWKETPLDRDRERCAAAALLAATEALEQGGVSSSSAGGLCIALGTGAGEARQIERCMVANAKAATQHEHEPKIPALVTAQLANALGVQARCLTFVNACTASSNAIATCLDLIRSGEAEVALAGGAETLSRSLLAGFNALRALDPAGCRPFDLRRGGTTMGEAAAFVLLESADRARARGQSVLAELSGYGTSSDAFHPTRADREGWGPQIAMRNALQDAGLQPSDIDYINAHGTGTFQNDMIELNAIKAVFGERSKEVAISSTKSQLGHTAGASGALECVTCVIALRSQFLVPTLHLEQPPPGFEDYNFVRDIGRPAQIRHVMSNSFAFGGFNVSLVLSSTADGNRPSAD